MCLLCIRRLAANPGYYSSELLAEDFRGGGAAAAERRRAFIAKFVDRLVNSSLDSLIELGCISLRLPEPWEQPSEASAADGAAEDNKPGEELTGFRLVLKQQQQEKDQQQAFEPIIEATPLGRIASFYYIQPQTAKRISDKMQVDASPLSFIDIFRLLTVAEEFSQMPLRYASSCCCCCNCYCGYCFNWWCCNFC